MFICVCVYMTEFIFICVYMTMFFCLQMRGFLSSLIVMHGATEELEGRAKQSKNLTHSPECCPRWAFNQKNLRSTNEEDGVGALLIRTDRNVKMQVPDWPNMRHW